jgi:salicylate hydroxylase
MNIVAFYTDPDGWEDTEKLTRWSKREEALEDFQDFGDDVSKILGLTEPELSVVSISPHA